jgi:hypothetical protein
LLLAANRVNRDDAAFLQSNFPRGAESLLFH